MDSSAIPQWATDLGIAAGIVAAIIGAVYAIARTPVARPFRAVARWAWSTTGKIWRLVVADPIGRWLTKLVGEAVEQSPLSKRVSSHMSSEEDQRRKDQIEREREREKLDRWREAVDERLDEGNGRMGALEEGHREIKDLLCSTLDELKAGNPEVRP